MKQGTRFTLSIVMTFLFTACEDNMFLRSEKNLKKEIQHVWKREFLTFSTYEEDWNFVNGKVYITRIEFNGNDTLDNGLIDLNTHDNVDTFDISEYSINAKIFNSFIKFSTFSADSSVIQYNTEWTIVELSDNVLYLATDGPHGSGVLQREFTKKN